LTFREEKLYPNITNVVVKNKPELKNYKITYATKENFGIIQEYTIIFKAPKVLPEQVKINYNSFTDQFTYISSEKIRDPLAPTVIDTITNEIKVMDVS
jgi:hypothetical protein